MQHLPAELQDAIAAHCEPRAVARLRATCSDLARLDPFTPEQRTYAHLWSTVRAILETPDKESPAAWRERFRIAKTSCRGSAVRAFVESRRYPNGRGRAGGYLPHLTHARKITFVLDSQSVSTRVMICASRSKGLATSIFMHCAVTGAKASFTLNHSWHSTWAVTVGTPSLEALEEFVERLRASALFDAQMQLLRHRCASVYMTLETPAKRQAVVELREEIREEARKIHAEGRALWKEAFEFVPAER